MFEFSSRAVDEEEILDSPDVSRRVAQKSYSFMEEVNRYYGGCRVIISFLEQEMIRGNIKKGNTCRILDLGSGACDIPREVIKWGKKNKIAIKYTCLDQHPRALELAPGKGRADNIRLVEADLVTYEPCRKYDYVTASMVMHHFSPRKIREIINKYVRWAGRAVVINDLHRHRFFYGLTWLRTFFTSRENRHDALLSIKKGFSVEELRKLAEELPQYSVGVKKMPLFRLRAVIRFKKEI